MKDFAWPSSFPTPDLSPAWCHLSSVSLKKGQDYNVSIWKRPHWDSEPDPQLQQQGAHAQMVDAPALGLSLISVTAVCFASRWPPATCQ